MRLFKKAKKYIGLGRGNLLIIDINLISTAKILWAISSTGRATAS